MLDYLHPKTISLPQRSQSHHTDLYTSPWVRPGCNNHCANTEQVLEQTGSALPIALCPGSKNISHTQATNQITRVPEVIFSQPLKNVYVIKQTHVNRERNLDRKTRNVCFAKCFWKWTFSRFFNFSFSFTLGWNSSPRLAGLHRWRWPTHNRIFQRISYLSKGRKHAQIF